MTKIIQQDNGALYQFQECDLKYEDNEIAERCENWCREHKSCNLDIIKHAIKDSPDDK